MGGLVVLVMADRGASGATGTGSAPLLGDTLVIGGACVYAVCNIAQVGCVADWVDRTTACDAPLLRWMTSRVSLEMLVLTWSG